MKTFLLGLVLGLIVIAGVLVPVHNNTNQKIINLEQDLDNLERTVANKTIHDVLREPSIMFGRLEDHPEWEEIDAVPYSRCYRHLIGTTTADYIICMAI